MSDEEVVDLNEEKIRRNNVMEEFCRAKASVFIDEVAEEAIGFREMGLFGGGLNFSFKEFLSEEIKKTLVDILLSLKKGEGSASRSISLWVLRVTTEAEEVILNKYPEPSFQRHAREALRMKTAKILSLVAEFEKECGEGKESELKRTELDGRIISFPLTKK